MRRIFTLLFSIGFMLLGYNAANSQTISLFEGEKDTIGLDAIAIPGGSIEILSITVGSSSITGVDLPYTIPGSEGIIDTLTTVDSFYLVYCAINSTCNTTDDIEVTYIGGSLFIPATRMINVVDITSPEIFCHDTTIYLDASGQVVFNTESLVDSVRDNCDTMVISQTITYTCDSIGDRTVMVIATDDAGNADTCIQTVTVLDTFPPSFTFAMDTFCHPDTIGCVSDTSTISYMASGTDFTSNCNVIMDTMTTFEEDGCPNNGNWITRFIISDTFSMPAQTDTIYYVVKVRDVDTVRFNTDEDTVYRDTVSCSDGFPDDNALIAEAFAMYFSGNPTDTGNCGGFYRDTLAIELLDSMCVNDFARAITLVIGDSCSADTLVYVARVLDTVAPMFLVEDTMFAMVVSCVEDTMSVADQIDSLMAQIDTSTSHCSDLIDTVIVEVTDSTCRNRFTRNVTMIIGDSCTMNSDTLTHQMEVNDTVAPMFLMSDTVDVPAVMCTRDAMTEQQQLDFLLSQIDTSASHCSDLILVDTINFGEDLTDSTCINQWSRTIGLVIGDSCTPESDTLYHMVTVLDTLSNMFNVTLANGVTKDTFSLEIIECLSDTTPTADMDISITEIGSCGDDTIFLLSNEVVQDIDGMDICPLNYVRLATFVVMDSCMNSDTVTFRSDVRGPEVDLGGDRYSCFDSWTYDSGIDTCQVASFTWELIQGDGELVDTMNTTVEYCPSGPDEIGDTVIIAIEVEPLNPNCENLYDTVMQVIFAPCFNCRAEVNFSCGSEVTLEDVLTGEYDSCQAAVFELEVTDQFGQRFENNIIPSDYEGEFWAKVTSSWDGTSCEALGSVDNKLTCFVEGNLDTTIWCVDEFLSIDPDGSYYRDTLGLRPYAVEHCTFDTCDVEYEGEWVTAFDCGDTLKQVVRGWRATTKAGNSCVNYDTITVIRLPNIADYIYAPLKDTLSCRYDTVYGYTFRSSFFSWKEIVGVHSDATVIRFPHDHSLSTDITEIYTAWDAIADDNLKDSLADEYVARAVIQRWDAGLGRYVGYSVLDLFDDMALFPIVTIDGEDYVEFVVRKGDRILTNGGAYNVVDDNWFYEANEHGFWIDLTLPYIAYTVEETVCDVWEQDCSGIQLILPNHPYMADTCKVFCMSEFGAVEKCLDVVHVEEKDLGGSCPRIVKRKTLIKQSCFADGAGLSTAGTFACHLDTNTTAVVTEMIGDAINIEAEQWIYYIDTLAPLLSSKFEPVELNFSTSDHDCFADVVLPQIAVKDDCSGIKAVKATVGTGYSWITYNDDDADGVWTADEGRTIRLACGESYEVQYEIMDNCHNVMMLDTNWVTIQDNVSPNVLSADTITVSIGSKDTWIDASTFDIGSEDNCGVRQVLVRRADWLDACGVNVCLDDLSGISSATELFNFIQDNGITAGLEQSDIEQYYAEQYDWLVNDGEFCPLPKGSLPGAKTFQELLIEGWHADIMRRWAEECVGQDAHGNNIIDIEDGFNLGGGWGDAIPVCCEDVCESVVVEILVIDKSCNYTKGWTVINVEDNSIVEEACQFDDLSISCSFYADNYADLVTAAQNGDAGAHEALDEALGGLLQGWRSADNRLVDAIGNTMDKTTTYQTTRCRLEPVEVSVFDTLHDGEVVWKTITSMRSVIDTVEVEIDLGGVYQLCGSDFVQSVWVELDDCGLGTITRRWEVYGGCIGGQVEHDMSPLIIDQVISIQPDCELTKYSLNVPNDTVICSDLVYTLEGEVDVDGGQLTYALGDLGCRLLGIGHSDQVFEVIGDPNLYKIHRTWTVTDWCSNEEVVCVQKIVLNTACDVESQAKAKSQELEGDEEESIARSQKSGEGKFALFQNAPNPFDERTVIKFNLPKEDKATLTIFDMTGKVLYTIEGEFEAGANQILIKESDLNSFDGSRVLFYQLQTAEHSATKQMTRLE